MRATAFIGNQSVATTVVPDNVLNASEGGGLVRTDKRQISLALGVDRSVDTVTIEAPRRPLAMPASRRSGQVKTYYSAPVGVSWRWIYYPSLAASDV